MYNLMAGKKKNSMRVRTFTAREMVYPKGSKYLAVSLDFDLFAEGSTLGEAMDRLKEASIGYIRVSCKDNEADKEIYRLAPKKYFDIYELLKELDEKKKKEKVREGFIGKATYDSLALAHA